MKDLTQLRLDTRMLLDESTAADFTAAQVDSAINYAYQGLITAVMTTYEDFYLTTDTIDSVADQQEYGESESLATDIFKIRRVQINYDSSSSNPRRAKQMIFDELADRDLGSTNIGSTSFPRYYVYGFGSNIKIGFLPIPPTAISDAIKVWYVQIQDDLSAAGDEINIPYQDRYGHLIGYGAAADLLSKGQQEESASTKYRTIYEMGLDKMQRELEDRKADGSKGVIDVIGVSI